MRPIYPTLTEWKETMIDATVTYETVMFDGAVTDRNYEGVSSGYMSRESAIEQFELNSLVMAAHHGEMIESGKNDHGLPWAKFADGSALETYEIIVDSDDEWNATHPLTFMADRLTVVEETSGVAYYVCDSCAVVLENADDSHIDDTETIDRLEAMGIVIRTGEYDNGGYWECDGCMETVIGTGHIYS